MLTSLNVFLICSFFYVIQFQVGKYHSIEPLSRLACVHVWRLCISNLQKPLPKLPVPPLQSTLYKYLGVMKPVLTPLQFAKTKYLVDEFRKPGGQGEMLQDCLIQAYHNKENWVYMLWCNIVWSSAYMYIKKAIRWELNCYNEFKGFCISNAGNY